MYDEYKVSGRDKETKKNGKERERGGGRKGLKERQKPAVRERHGNRRGTVDVLQ